MLGETASRYAAVRFAIKNCRCYYIVDHGQTLDDSTVPLIWYQFTGAEDPL
jgi:hypothetical protein